MGMVHWGLIQRYMDRTPYNKEHNSNMNNIATSQNNLQYN